MPLEKSNLLSKRSNNNLKIQSDSSDYDISPKRKNTDNSNLSLNKLQKYSDNSSCHSTNINSNNSTTSITSSQSLSTSVNASMSTTTANTQHHPVEFSRQDSDVFDNSAASCLAASNPMISRLLSNTNPHHSFHNFSTNSSRNFSNCSGLTSSSNRSDSTSTASPSCYMQKLTVNSPFSSQLTGSSINSNLSSMNATPINKNFNFTKPNFDFGYKKTTSTLAESGLSKSVNLSALTQKSEENATRASCRGDDNNSMTKSLTLDNTKPEDNPSPPMKPLILQPPPSASSKTSSNKSLSLAERRKLKMPAINCNKIAMSPSAQSASSSNSGSYDCNLSILSNNPANVSTESLETSVSSVHNSSKDFESYASSSTLTSGSSRDNSNPPSNMSSSCQNSQNSTSVTNQNDQNSQNSQPKTGHKTKNIPKPLDLTKVETPSLLLNKHLNQPHLMAGHKNLTPRSVEKMALITPKKEQKIFFNIDQLFEVYYSDEKIEKWSDPRKYSIHKVMKWAKWIDKTFKINNKKFTGVGVRK